MKKIIIFFLFSVFNSLTAQSSSISQAVNTLLSSPKMYAANLSFYVADEQGNFIYEYNGNKGLSTASTQKLFTAAAALETLGSNYRYTTTMAYDGNLKDGILEGNLYLKSNGDPTLGSWRYKGYQPEDFLNKVLEAIKKEGIKTINGNLIIDDSYFDFQTIPGGWAWNDLGNYYGAGVWGINWRENQFDIKIKGGKNIGDGTTIEGFSYPLLGVQWINETLSGSPQSGDQSYIYTSPHSLVATINGTLPAQKLSTVSGATPNPPMQLGAEIQNILTTNGIHILGTVKTTAQFKIDGLTPPTYPKTHQFFEYQSPTLDQIIYWFLRKSVNLYGETLVRTISKVKYNDSNLARSVEHLKKFWSNKGIRSAMINFTDGSGLSPQNYASARAEVQALIWAKQQPWFPQFYDALPIYNGMKMKSGTIKSTKAYAGYHTSKSGQRYVFSIIVNNYEGDSINSELFNVLNTLK